MRIQLHELIRESMVESLTSDDSKNGKLKNLVIAGLLLWASLTHSGRNAVKQAYQALHSNRPVASSVQSAIESEIPYTPKELEDFIQGQIDHREKVEKEIGPVSKKIFQSKAFFRDN